MTLTQAIDRRGSTTLDPLEVVHPPTCGGGLCGCSVPEAGDAATTAAASGDTHPLQPGALSSDAACQEHVRTCTVCWWWIALRWRRVHRRHCQMHCHRHNRLRYKWMQCHSKATARCGSCALLLMPHSGPCTKSRCRPRKSGRGAKSLRPAQGVALSKYQQGASRRPRDSSI